MKNYYADFLQTKNFENTPGKAVSKVSKGQKSDSKQAFDTFDTALPSVNQKIKVSAVSLKQGLTKTDETDLAPTLTTRLNALIAAGVSFDVGAADFQAFGASERENAFLQANKTAILCTLHQSLLMKHLPFSDLEMFKEEISERTAIQSDGDTLEPSFEIVAEISRVWFIDMLQELAKQK